MEEFLKNWMLNYHQYAYLILFLWCILEGELALILGGILAHKGYIDIRLAIFIAGLGAFVGDQIYFYIGRYNQKFITKRLSSQRSKFAIAHLLLQRYGWILIFLQRYLYGFRTIIPMSIGITRYNARKFALINLISGWCWAAITIVLAWYFGDEIWKFINIIEEHWYYFVPLVVVIVFGFFRILGKIENRILTNRKERR
ncbi:MAG: DedA family protein [Campylobacter sp.]